MLNIQTEERDYEKPRWMTLYDENDKDVGAKILLKSRRCKAYKVYESRQSVKEARFVTKLQNRIKRDKATDEQVERLNELQDTIINEGVAKHLIVDWKGIGTPDKSKKLVELPFNEENALTLLSVDYIRSQIDTFVMDNTNFGGIEEEQKEDAKGNS